MPDIYDAILQYYRESFYDDRLTREELEREGNRIGLLYTTLDDYELDPMRNGFFEEAYDVQVYADLEYPGLVYEYTARDEYYADFTRRIKYSNLDELAEDLYNCEWDNIYSEACRLFDPIARKEVRKNA